jgi:diacylglycerol O-acyltransferase / wax synthase
MSGERLSALDASFLAVEGPAAPMHVGWVAVLDPPEHGPRPRFDELFEHLSGRLGRAPRYRQRLAGVPLALHDPVWVDDAGFDPAAHLLPGDGDDLSALVDSVLSTPLARDRPLWEITIADELPDGRLAMVGKMHHCMVDGGAVAELGNLLLDADPNGWREPGAEPSWSPAPVPSPGQRLARAVVERAEDSAALLLAPARVVGSPRRLRGLPGAVRRGARTAAHTLLPPAPSSPLNQPGSARRHHVRLTRRLDEIRTVRRRFRVTPNDVVLAACAGGLRRFAERRGEPPQPLKAMVPADVRSSSDAAGTGNRISFVFVELPCAEPGPVERLQAVHRATAARRRDGEAEELDAAFRVLARTPTPLQRALAHAFAHPRLFNLTVSSVPGPAVPRYLRGCRLREVHSAVPLAGRHALSIGVVTVAGNACFAVTADAHTLPDADALAADLDAAIDELLAAPHR